MENQEIRVSMPPVPISDILVRLYQERYRVYGFMARRVRDSAVWQDIFQQACLRMLESRATFPHFAPAAKYFYRTVTNLMNEHHSRMSRLKFFSEMPEISYDPRVNWDKEMLLERVCEATQDLTPKDRSVLAASFDDSLSCLKEKAHSVGKKVCTFRHRKAVIIRKLRRTLRKEPLLKRMRKKKHIFPEHFGKEV